MFNLIFNYFICSTIGLGVSMKFENITNYVYNSQQAQVIIDGTYYQVDDIDNLNNVLRKMLEDSYDMPALGVSIHTEVIKGINQGTWLKLQYNGTQYVDDMPFDELLIEVNSEFGGFNIIRGNKGIYEGRCYYVNLYNSTMQTLSDYISLNVIS